MTTPPLQGLRIIECSALGPAAITTALVDLGADVIKVEPPAGDYIREMTWPIVEGTSLMHLHLNRGKRSLVLDLRTDAGVGIFKELAAGADVVVEAMRPGSLARRGVGFEDAAGHEPQARVLHHLGLRDDRPLPGLPEPRDRLRHLGRHRQGRHRRRGIHLHPRARVHRDQRRTAVRRARHSRRGHPGPRHGRGLVHRRRPVRRRGGPGLVSQRDLAGLRATGVRGHRQQGRRLRAARPGHRGHGRGVRYQVYETSDHEHVLFMASEQAFWKNFCEAVDRMDLFERWPGSKYADHARGNRELRAELRDIFATKTAKEWLDFGGRVNTPIAPVNTPKTLLDDPQFADRFPLLPADGGGSGPALHPAALRRRGAAAPGQGTHGRPAHRGRLALRARL